MNPIGWTGCTVTCSRWGRVFWLVMIAVFLALPGVAMAAKGGNGGGGGGGGGKPGGGGGSEDNVAPAAVTDLAASDATFHTATLTWTATADDGDDGASGPASSYDIRYLMGEPVTEANWGDAFQARGEPMPLGPGEVEIWMIKGLLPETDYHLAMKAVDDEGNASGLSNVAIASTVAGSWTVLMVERVGHGYYHCMAFDPLDGNPSVTYAAGGGVKFAHYDGSSWQIEVVDGNDDATGQFLAYDPDNGHATVSYGWGPLQFADRLGTDNWDIEVVDTKAYNDQTGLAYDASGNPAIAYKANAKGKSWLNLARWNGSGWDIETVDGPAAGRWKSLAFDLDGNPGIAYSADPDGDGWLSALKYAHWNGQSWDIETVEDGTRGFGTSVSLAYHPTQGYPAILHDGPRYLQKSSGSWELEIADCLGGRAWLAFAPDATPTVGFIRFLSGELQGNELWIGRRVSGAWQCEFITSGISGGQSPTNLRFSPEGRPAMSAFGIDGFRFAIQKPQQ